MTDEEVEIKSDFSEVSRKIEGYFTKTVPVVVGGAAVEVTY